MKISPFFFIFWGISILFGDVSLLLYIFICAVVHESAHICCYLYFNVKISSIELLPFGISVTLHNTNHLTYSKEIICAAAGVTANVLFALLSALLSRAGIISGVETLIYCNAALAGINLIPAMPLDGGRIIHYLLLERIDIRKAENASRIISFLVAIPLTLFGIWLIFTERNISVLLIGIYLIICNIKV